MKTMNMTTAAMGMIGAIVLLAAGCTVKTGGNHTLVSNIPETIPSGTCVAVEGPYSVPSGTDMAYSIFNDFSDDFDVGIDSGDCSLFYAYGQAPGTDVSSSEIVPSGSYYLEIQCFYNGGLACLPTVDYWTADY